MPSKIAQRLSKIHGNGVFATAPIKKGEEVVEYKGRIVTHAQADRQHWGDVTSGHTFLFTLNEKYIIDANVDGNVARWLNHSCSPNCIAFVHGDPKGDLKKDRVIIEALRDIKPGEELTYNYDITLEQRHTPALKKLWACHCGSKNCTGTMLQPKR
jgi:uncharacterized protein